MALAGAAALSGEYRPPAAESPPATYLVDSAALESMRGSADVGAQRRHVWDVIAYLTHPSAGPADGAPLFETWHGEEELFGTGSSGTLPAGIRGFSRTSVQPADAGAASGIPVISYTLYNEPAYQHIRRYRLNEAAGLKSLRESGAADPIAAANVTVPAFPVQSIVLKTVWWPVARDAVTALPVWDPALNPPNPLGNPYTSWSRVVALDPFGTTPDGGTTRVSFAGRSFPAAKRVGLRALNHVVVDARMARSLMRDPETRKAILISLGRPIEANDYLALVSANLMTRETANWIWAAFWWHDQPEDGPFAADRPTALRHEWRNYLMEAAFDASVPAARDGGPRICFNPWLEGRFPDGGRGGGVTSNCMACHQRASLPRIGFLPVTRGPPDVRNDEAYEPGRLRTSFLWSLVLHARP